MNANPTPPTPLQDRVILVTGAGQGLGRASALACAKRGATVVLLGRTTAKLERVYDDIVGAGGPQPAIFPMDIEKATDHDFDTLAQTLGYQMRRLDGIVHCASEFETPCPLSQQTAEQWQRLYKVNVIAPFAINRACLPLLTASPDASVILIGESHGHAPAAYWGGFAVSKAALEAYLRIQSEEWSGLPNLRVNLVLPGPINSPQRARSHPGEDKSTLPTPADVAGSLADLMGPDARDRRGELIEWRPGAD